MTNGCQKCEELAEDEICIDCRLEQAEWEAMAAMDKVEELKKEKRNEL